MSPHRWFPALLLLLLTSCSDSSSTFHISSPDDSAIRNGSGEFVFKVYNLSPDSARQGEQLWQQADAAVNGFLSSGNYTVRFTDGRVGDQVLVISYSLTPDLLFQHDIHLLDYTYGPRFSQAAALPHPQRH
ncbi:hypothetical protein [Hymenobacter agri]